MTSKHDIPFPFDSFPEMESERLRFSQISKSDAESLLALRSNKDVVRYIKRSLASNLKEIQEFIAYIQKGFSDDQFIFWTVRKKESSEIIGTISLWHFTDDKTEAEIGYELHPNHWGQGFADESVKHILAFGFEELALSKIEAFTHWDNQASKKLLVNNCFVLQPQRVDTTNEDNRIFIREK